MTPTDTSMTAEEAGILPWIEPALEEVSEVVVRIRPRTSVSGVLWPESDALRDLDAKFPDGRWAVQVEFVSQDGTLLRFQDGHGAQEVTE